MENKIYKKPKYVSPRVKKSLKNTFWTWLFPVIGLIFLVAGSLSSGSFGDATVFKNMVISVVTILIACFALNTNLNSGRMDFSLGAVGILATVVAWKLLPNKTMPNFAIAYLALSLFLGLIFGLISGLIFITLKIPAIVVSLGVCLIYEGAAYVITAGKGSVDIPASIAPDLYPFITSPVFIVITILVVCVFMLLVLKYSAFGHDKLSLLYGQKVSVDTGVNEFKNALICYALAGVLIAFYTYILSINQSKITVQTNLGSAMSVMANFLPIFLGGLIAKHSNEVVGLFLGVVSVVMFKQGLTRFGVSDSTISLVTSFLIFIILTYMVNWTNWVRIVKNKIKNYKLQYYEGKNNK